MVYFVTNDVIVFINSFYQKKRDTSMVYSPSYNELIDSILQIISTLINYNPQNISSSLEIFILCDSVIEWSNDDSKNLTLNPIIKSDFLSIMSYYVSNKNYVFERAIQLNYKPFLCKLVDLFVYFEKHDHSEINQIKIISILDDSGYVSYLASPDVNILSRRFLNIFLNKLVSSFATLIKIVRNINRVQRSLPIESGDLSDLDILKFYLNNSKYNIILLLKFINNICQMDPYRYLGSGLKEQFITMINHILFTLVEQGSSSSLKIKPNGGLEFKVLTIMNFIFKLIYNYKDNYSNNNNSDFINAMSEDSKYSSANTNTFMSILLTKNKILLSEYNNMVCIIAQIDKSKDVIERLDDIDIPDKFNDPIMGTIIKTPVILPESDIIMDKNIIMRYILEKEENPFTRHKLTVKELEDFNKNETILGKCKCFKKELISFIKEQTSKI